MSNQPKTPAEKQSHFHARKFARKDSRTPEDAHPDGMPTASLPELVAEIDRHTESKFEHFFVPALAVFSMIIVGVFYIIYLITADMSRLANTMDSNMDTNMTSMAVSIDELSASVRKMTLYVDGIQHNFNQMNKHMGAIVQKLDNLDQITFDLNGINGKMDQLHNMEKMNKNMKEMSHSMRWMQKDINRMRTSFSKPMNVLNSMPSPF